jgi:purine-binding chemotaxis protein CheW
MSEMENELEQTQYLTFQLAGQEYAMGILQVKEIIAYGTLTKVPQTPRSIRGVINLRGNVVPVVDIAVKFGLPPSPITDRSCVIIVETNPESEKIVIGIVADSVSQVIDLPAQDILPAPAFGTLIRLDYLRGMIKTDQKFVLLLDIDKVLSAEDTAVTGGLNHPHPETPLNKDSAHPDE